MNDDLHFNTFETDFFEQGDDNASLPIETERFEDLDDSQKRRHGLFSRPSLLVVGACIAVLGCAALWRGKSHASPPAVVAGTESPTKPIPQPARTETPVAEAAPVAMPAPVAEAEPVAKPAPVAEAAPLAEVAPVAEAEPDNTQARCQDAIRGKRNKDILAVCPAAISEDPIAADIAVALARIEFDRGRSTQASAWSKKAIAANPDAADAYVFLGGAEQNAGHGKAAKQAYQHYLRLAPAGRYAADLRAIVNSL